MASKWKLGLIFFTLSFQFLLFIKASDSGKSESFSISPRPEPTARKKDSLLPHHNPEQLKPCDYRVLRVLGSGGQGTVLLCRRQCNRYCREKMARLDCAVKLIDRDRLFRNEKLLFRHEVESLAILRSRPRLLGLQHIMKCEDCYYIVTDFVPGMTVDKYLIVDFYPSTPQLLEFQGIVIKSIVGQLLLAVRDLHALGLLHRDIKPGNIMVGDNGAITLVDMGYTAPEGIDNFPRCGSALYSAPELWAGERHSKASDIFALGMTIATLVVGGDPYVDQDTPMEEQWSQGTAKICWPEDADKDLIAFVEAATDKDPSRRAELCELMDSQYLRDFNWDEPLSIIADLIPLFGPDSLYEQLMARQASEETSDEPGEEEVSEKTTNEKADEAAIEQAVVTTTTSTSGQISLQDYVLDIYKGNR